MSGKRKASGVWTYFDVDVDDQSVAVCNVEVCTAKTRKVKRGNSDKDSSNYSTSGLWKHLKLHHPNLESESKEKRAQADDLRNKRNEEEAEKKKIYRLTQPTLQEILDKDKKWPTNHPEQRTLNFMLAEWICDGVEPYSIVENERFQVYIQRLSPKYTLPSEKTLRLNIVPNIFEKVHGHVKQLLAEQLTDYCSLTTDIWSSATDSYISATLHFINKEWEQKMVVLNCFPFNSSHTAEQIADKLSTILSSWEINDQLYMIIRDNASNMIAAMNSRDWIHTGCFLHTLHLIVTHSILEQSGVESMIKRCKKLVKYFHKSTKAMHILHKHQRDLDMKEHVLLRAQQTRWSSYYNMLCRISEQKRAIRRAEDDPEIKLNSSQILTANDWDLIIKVIKLLKPFHDVTIQGESEAASISEVIPNVKYLIYVIQKLEVPGCGTLKDELVDNIKRYFRGAYVNESFGDIESQEKYAIATILDPRFKSSGFADSGKSNLAKQMILNALQMSRIDVGHIEVNEVVDPGNSSTSNSDWDDILLDEDNQFLTPIFRDQTELEGIELQKFLADQKIKRTNDPFVWWRKNEECYPRLAKLARKYLPPPLGSVASEREFKQARNIVHDRNRLKSENVEMLLFLKYNLKAIGYNSISL